MQTIEKLEQELLDELNKPEPKEKLIARLLAEIKEKSELATLPSVSDFLEFRRDQWGLSRKEFAEILDVGVSHYSEIVNGKRQLPFNSTKRAYAIGIPADVLMRPDPLAARMAELKKELAELRSKMREPAKTRGSDQ